MNATPILRPIEQVKPELRAAEAALHTATHQALSYVEGTLGVGSAAGEVIALLSRRGMFAEAAELAQRAAAHRALQDEWYHAACAKDRSTYAEFVEAVQGDGVPGYLQGSASDVV
jgi:hypothetical protein